MSDLDTIIERCEQEMADLGATLCIAFWDYASKGTADMLDRANHAGIPTEIVTVPA